MRVLFNPTDKDLTITYGGTNYTVEAGKEMKILDEKTERAVEYWTTQIHQFLKVREVIDTTRKEIKVEEKKPDIKPKVVVEEKKEVKVEEKKEDKEELKDVEVKKSTGLKEKLKNIIGK